MSTITTVTIGTTLAVSAGIHASIVGAHLREWWLAGAFFVIAAVVQAFCAYAVLRTRSMRIAGIGAIVSLVLIAAWVMSRSFGLPFGPGAGEREAIAVLDVLATAAEVATVGGVLAARRSAFTTRGTLTRSSRLIPAAIVASTFGVGTATAAALPAHSHTHAHDAGHAHTADAADVVHRTAVRPRISQATPTGVSTDAHAHADHR
jgi:hypothetical protein